LECPNAQGNEKKIDLFLCFPFTIHFAEPSDLWLRMGDDGQFIMASSKHISRTALPNTAVPIYSHIH
jgi:hypothetical protein